MANGIKEKSVHNLLCTVCCTKTWPRIIFSFYLDMHIRMGLLYQDFVTETGTVVPHRATFEYSTATPLALFGGSLRLEFHSSSI